MRRKMQKSLNNFRVKVAFEVFKGDRTQVDIAEDFDLHPTR